MLKDVGFTKNEWGVIFPHNYHLEAIIAEVTTLGWEFICVMDKVSKQCSSLRRFALTHKFPHSIWQIYALGFAIGAWCLGERTIEVNMEFLPEGRRAVYAIFKVVGAL